MSEMISLVAPVSRERIERWVAEQVDGLRDEAAASGLQLGRLTACPTQDADWLLEVDARERGVAPQDDLALTSILTHLEWLGLRPQLLVSSRRESPAVAADFHESSIHAPAPPTAYSTGPSLRSASSWCSRA